MKLDSFKYKISLLSLLLSGAVMIVFGLFFISAIYRIGFERIDRELRVLADAQVRRPQPPEHWQRFEKSMQTVYGESSSSRIMVRATSSDGKELYVSSQWPAGLTKDKLPSPGPVVKSERPEEGPRQRRRPADSGFGQEEAVKMSRMRPPDAGGPDREGHGPAEPPKLEVSRPAYSTVVTDKGSWRIAVLCNKNVVLYIALDLASFYAETNRFRNTFLVAMPVALLLLAFGGWLIAHRALRPVKVIAETAGSITTMGLGRRIPRTDADREFAGLIDVINGMLDRLEKSFQQAVRFSGDAAHELKTPLTILQGQLEQALQEAPAGSEMQQRYSGLLEEVRRLASITRKLLLLSQADSGRMKLNLLPFDLSSALESISEDAAILAPDLTLEKRIEPGMRVMADADLINQVLQNLLTNAIKYNEKNGWIRFDLHAQGDKAEFVISNSGEEIPEAETEMIFDRFYRVNKSRNREIDGAGLGLSLAREIVIAHKGELRLERSSDGETVFVLKLARIG